MKKRIAAALALGAALSFCCAVAGGSASAQQASAAPPAIHADVQGKLTAFHLRGEAVNGRTISVKAGDQVKIVLQEQPALGAVWSLKKPVGAAVKFTGKGGERGFKSNPVIFSFQAQSSGSVTLEFEYGAVSPGSLQSKVIGKIAVTVDVQ